MNIAGSGSVKFGDMETNSEKPSPGFAKGQLWKTDDTYLQIIDLGKRQIHYKVMKKPDQPAVTRLIRTEALAVYLKATEAELMN